MKSLLTFILCLLSVSVFGQPSVKRTPLTTNDGVFTSPTVGQIPKIHSVAGGILTWTNADDAGGGNLNPFTTNTFVGVRAVTDGSWSLLTNQIALSTGPSDPVIVFPGVYFGTNQFSWAGKYIHFMPGAIIRQGLDNNYTPYVGATVNALFTDHGIAKTTYVTGFGEFYMSNNCSMVYNSNASSVIYFECSKAWNDTLNSGNALFFHQGGDGDYFFRDSAYGKGYDTVDVYGGRSTWRGRRLLGSDHQAFEAQGDNIQCEVNFDIVEPYTNNPSAGPIISMEAGVRFQAGRINCYSNTFVEFLSIATAAPVGEALLDNTVIWCPTNNTGKVLINQDIVGNPALVRNTKIIGSLTATPVLVEGGTLYLENTDVIAGDVATDTIGSGSSGSVYTKGVVNLNKKMQSTVTFRGAITSTNTFALPETPVPARPLTNTVGLFSRDIGNISRLGFIDDANNPYTFSFTSPTANQVVGFHDDKTFTNLTASVGAGGGITSINDMTNALQYIQSASAGLTVTTNGNASKGTNTLLLLTNSSTISGVVSPGVADKVWKTDGSGNPAWRDDATGAGGGDAALVNATTVSDSFSLTNTAATSTAPSTTWSISSGVDPDPDKISLAIGAASGTVAGVVTAVAQTFGGDKLFTGAVTNQGKLQIENELNFPPITMTDAFVDGRTNTYFTSLTGNTTAHLTNFSLGTFVVWLVKQDSTGTRTLGIDSTNTLEFFDATNQTAAVAVNTNANFLSELRFYKRNATTVVVYGPYSSPSRFDVEWSSGSVPSSDVASRVSNETGTGALVFADGPTLGSATLTSNITFTSVLLSPQSNLTNFTADFAFAERHYLLTNNFHVSAVSSTATDDTNPKYWTAKLENLSGSTKIVSVASAMKRGGTNNVNVPNGSAATVWLRSHGSQLSNTVALITLYDSP